LRTRKLLRANIEKSASAPNANAIMLKRGFVSTDEVCGKVTAQIAGSSPFAVTPDPGWADERFTKKA
jgi:hypothetical protein